jgi:phosphatidylserine/phosphatidylglycerophosphate/cardiolipin synthase-like enzyme
VIDDIQNHTTSSLFYSLAFLYQTPDMEKAIDAVTARDDLFVYGLSDRRVGGVHLHLPNGNVPPVYPAQLQGDMPEPFKAEPTGGGGIRLHDKYAVIDFDKPTARVYLGSYNFSTAADLDNGENLVLIRDRRIATAYMIDALRTFDHYEFRVWQNDKTKLAKKPLALQRPPKPGEKAWWEEDWSNPVKIRDRLLFA